MRLYLAGPMTGYPEYNFPAFFAAENVLRDRGFHVMNPAAHTVGIMRFYSKPIDDPWILDESKRWDAVAVARADGIAVLDGWERSGGAQVEVTLAHWLGILVKPVGEWKL